MILSEILKKELKKKWMILIFIFGNSTRSNWNWTSLMRPEKKILQHFPVSKFVTRTRGVAIENLWREFYKLYMILWKSSHNEEAILNFKKYTKNWVRNFCQPTIGPMNSAMAIPGLYRKEDITLYMHMLTMHVPDCIRRLKEIGLSIRLFSTSSIEKKNHNQVYITFKIYL